MNWVRSFGLVLLDIFIAMLGTAILQSPLERTIPAHTINSVIAREWILSFLCAAVLGFIAYWRLRSKTSVHVWIVAAIWFGFGIIINAVEIHPHSVMDPLINSRVSFWSHFSGQGCVNGIRSRECMNFFVFTLVFIRTAAYSIGAKVAACKYVESPKVHKIISESDLAR